MSKIIPFALFGLLLVYAISYSTAFAVKDEVRVVGHKMYSDDSGLKHITGIVGNEKSVPVGPISITAKLFDRDGNPLPSYETTGLFWTLMPGYLTPFDIPISDRNVGEKLGSYSLSIKWRETGGKPQDLDFSAIDAFTVTHLDERTVGYMGSKSMKNMENDDTHAHTEVSGYVTNKGNLTTQSAKVAVVWYDKEGKFYGMDWQSVSKKLASGEKARFVFMTHPKGMGFYSIIASTEDYTAMLTLNGENIIPVYEAPKLDIGSPMSNAISISNVRLVDENSNPVSDVRVNKAIMLQSIIKNNLSTDQKFTIIYQVKDADSTQVMLFWNSSRIPASESLDTAISWVPEREGNYTLQIFVWESLKNPVPLSQFYESTISVFA